MKNNTNIYDIDGELIRSAGDNHQFTIEEAKNRINYYQEKIKSLSEKENKTPEDEAKIRIYEQYCTNLMNYEWSKMMQMNQGDLTNLIKSAVPQQTAEEDINKALTELNNDIETGNDTENKVSEQHTTDNTGTTNEELRDDETIERPISDIHEERSLSQSDLLVERDNVTNDMDEYVSYKEV